VTQNIITYLNENKEKYPKEVLITELQKSGYSEGDITEGVAQVFEGKTPTPASTDASTSFWNFKDKKIYTSARQKWKDFLFGVFAPFFVGLILNIFSLFFLGTRFIFGIAVFVLWVVLLIHLFNRRRHMFYGTLLSVVLLPLTFILFMVAVFSRHGF
jgi:hypothetical protein